MTLELEQRANVVREARRWLGTPYHHRARVLGAGVDCAQILIKVFAAAGLIEDFEPGIYPADWHLHRGEERYLEAIAGYATEFDPAGREILAGDIVIFQHGRTFSHGAIVTGAPGTLSGWPWIVHAFARAQLVEEISAAGSPLLRLADGRPRPFRAFSYWSR